MVNVVLSLKLLVVLKKGLRKTISAIKKKPEDERLSRHLHLHLQLCY